MNDRQLIASMLRMAKMLSQGVPAKSRQARERKAYGLIRNPNKVIKNMKDKGIALNYDGSLWTYPISGIGIPDYSRSPKLWAKNADSSASKTKKISDSLKVKASRYKELLDEISKFKRMLLGMMVNDETIDDMKFFFKNELQEFINNRVRDPKLKSINSELESIKQKVADGDFKGAAKNASIIQDVLAEGNDALLTKWQGQHEYFVKQRKMMLEINRLLSRNPEVARELATIGTPPSDSEKEGMPAGPKMELSGSEDVRNLAKDIKRAIKLHGTLMFEYAKKDGSVRSVRVNPTDLKRTGSGLMIVGYDLDRKGERNFLVSGIQ